MGDLLFRQLYDLRCIWLLCILNIAESKRRPVDKKLDESWLLIRYRAFENDGPDAYDLVELSVGGKSCALGLRHLTGTRRTEMFRSSCSSTSLSRYDDDVFRLLDANMFLSV